MGYRPVVRIPFLNIGVSSGEVSCQETETSIMIVQSDPDGALVPRHASQAGLESELRSNTTGND